jgi:hypothetical protein
MAVDGLLAVPIDITSVAAAIDIDAATGTATATAVVVFTAGPANGNPVLDLRQTVTAVALDGTPLPVSAFGHHDLGGGAGAQMRVLDAVVSAGTAHVLTLSYDVGLPQSPAGGSYAPALEYSAGPRVRLSFGFTDLAPARYLESWLPANLIYDSYPIQLDLTVTGTAVGHTLISNATVTTTGANQWHLEWPATSTAMSTLVELRASDTVTGESGTVVLPVSGRTVTIDAWKLTTSPVDLGAQVASIRNYLTANENTIGPYPHGDRFVAFFNVGGMEYDGGTTTTVGALRHETHHSWWARGWRPAPSPDGWIDEGWTVYHDNGGGAISPFDFTDPPVTLRPCQSVDTGDVRQRLRRRFALLRRAGRADRCRDAAQPDAGVLVPREVAAQHHRAPGGVPGTPHRGSRDRGSRSTGSPMASRRRERRGPVAQG